MMDDVEHLLLCIVAIYKSSLQKCVFKFLVHFSVVWCVFLLLSCKCSLYVWILAQREIHDLQIFSAIVSAVFARSW